MMQLRAEHGFEVSRFQERGRFDGSPADITWQIRPPRHVSIVPLLKIHLETPRCCRDADSHRLLETGSTQLIRNTAATQLADVQKAHPEELFHLLTRVVPYLRHKTWDTRIAAAKALGGIVDNADRAGRFDDHRR